MAKRIYKALVKAGEKIEGFEAEEEDCVNLLENLKPTVNAWRDDRFPQALAVQ